MSKRLFQEIILIAALAVVSIACTSGKQGGGTGQKQDSATVAPGGQNCRRTENVAEVTMAGAKKIVTDSVGSPDTVIAVDNTRYFAVVTDVAGIAQGLYFLDLTERRIEKLIGGSLSNISMHSQKDGVEWMCCATGNIDGGINSTCYKAIVAGNGRTGKIPTVCDLICLDEDGESGGCGGKERAAEIGLTSAGSLDEYSFTDMNGDGFTDISMAITMDNCQSGEKIKEMKVFTFSGDVFTEAGRGNGTSDSVTAPK